MSLIPIQYSRITDEGLQTVLDERWAGTQPLVPVRVTVYVFIGVIGLTDRDLKRTFREVISSFFRVSTWPKTSL
jgi:hypothetical protein